MSKPIRIKSLQNLTQQASRARKRPSHLIKRHPFDLRTPEASLSATPYSITSTELSLILPIPPSINHQYATVNGRRILSSKGRQYKTAVAQQILSTLTASPNRKALLNNLQTHSLNLSVWFYFTSALRRDLDGGLKISQDAICNAMDINDNRISEIHLYKAVDVKSPRMECTLSINQSAPLPRQKKKHVSPSKRLSLNRLPRRTRRS